MGATKTKVLYIYGDDDYGALNFEDYIEGEDFNKSDANGKIPSNESERLDKFMKENNLVNNGDKYVGENFNVILKIFDGPIPYEFEIFIKEEICDYDSLKNISFIII